MHDAEIEFAGKIIVECDQTFAAAIQIANGVQRPGGADGVCFAFCRSKLEPLFGSGQQMQPLIGFFTVFL